MIATQAMLIGVEPLVVLAEGPRPRLVPAVALPPAEPDREDERDVEADDRDRRADRVADEVVPDRGDHQDRREDADAEDRPHGHAVLRHAPPERVSGHRAVAREREHHPRRRGHRRRHAEELRDDADEQERLGPVLAHRLGPDPGDDDADVLERSLRARDRERHREQQDPAEDRPRRPPTSTCRPRPRATRCASPRRCAPRRRSR